MLPSCGDEYDNDNSSKKLGCTNLLQGPPAMAAQVLRKALRVLPSVILCEAHRPIPIPPQSNILTCTANWATSIGFGSLLDGQQGRKWLKDSILGC